MTWIGKKEFGIWSGRGNPESKREGVGNRSVFGVAFWDWDVVAKRFWGAFSGRGLRGVSSDCESMDKTPHRKYSVIIPLIVYCIIGYTYRSLTTLTNLFLQEMLPVLLFFRVGITYFYVTTRRPKHLFDDGTSLRRI